MSGYYLIERGKGTPLPLDPTRILVTSGPYRCVRNPQAIAMLILSAGEVIALRSMSIWLLMPWTIIYLEGLAGLWEDRELTRRFGEPYIAYRRRVG